MPIQDTDSCSLLSVGIEFGSTFRISSDPELAAFHFTSAASLEEVFMSFRRWARALAFAGAVSMGSVGWAGPVTKTFDVSTGGVDSLNGSLSGSISATVTSGSIIANFTDVDIDTNILDFTNRTGSVTLTVTPGSSVAVNIPSTNFNTGLTGNVVVTADDDGTDNQLGVLGGFAPGNDGKWDDLDGDGNLGNATFNSATLAASAPITASANVSGSISGVGSGSINLGTVLFQTLRLDVLNTSNATVLFDPVQTVKVSNLSISTSNPFAINVPVSSFTEGTHPLDGLGLTTILDQSAGAGALASTTVSGTLEAQLTGRLNASIDLRVRWGSITLTTLNDAFNGDLVTGQLFDLSEDIALTESIPFVIQVLHAPTTNVDYDDIVALAQTGTLGISVPINLATATSIAFPSTNFEVLNLSTTGGTVNINDLDIRGNLGGAINVNLAGSAALNVNLLAQALAVNELNISSVPEASTWVMMSIATLGGLGLVRKTRRSSPGA
jgi:hypothetical protein